MYLGSEGDLEHCGHDAAGETELSATGRDIRSSSRRSAAEARERRRARLPGAARGHPRDGHLPPDADLRLDEKQLAAALGVSRTPVRQALARLEHEGLVRIMPRRGVLSLRKSKAEIIEMIRAWAALESMAARLALRARERRGDRASLRALFSTLRGRRAAPAPGRVLRGQPPLPPAHHRARPLAACSRAWPTGCSCTCGRSAAA